ncbi:MAG: hypothetical protein R2822_02140 [Spirosomataceae bacterium]
MGFNGLIFIGFTLYFWSIYYQWQVAKQWCPLCVAVQVVIWLECGSILLPLLIENGINFPSLTREGIQGWGLMAAAFSIPILLWLIIKPLLQKSRSRRMAARTTKV